MGTDRRELRIQVVDKPDGLVEIYYGIAKSKGAERAMGQALLLCERTRLPDHVDRISVTKESIELCGCAQRFNPLLARSGVHAGLRTYWEICHIMRCAVPVKR
jgi:hypothetical protein